MILRHPGRSRFALPVLAAAFLSGMAFAQTAPLAITTVPPLFNGTVGVAYVQVFSASGGTAPYTWKVLEGNTGGLTLDAASGTLQGTPQNAGTFSFTIQVTDQTKATASKSFSVTVNAPSLTITTGAFLPAAPAGVSYSQKFSVTGGTPPYTWTMTTGSVPGLTFDGAQATLSGTPTTPGTFTFTLQASDAKGLTASRSFSVNVTPASLKITNSTQLPNTILGSSLSYQMTATGGAPPYTWSANGLPDGITLDSSTGLLHGTAQSAGAFAFTIRVTDSTLATYVDLFHITIGLPSVPSISISGLPATAGAAQQIPIQVTIDAAYSSALSGQVLLTFSPDVVPAGGGDGTIQFSTGGTTANFTIPAGSTAAVFSAPPALQTGTVAGTISLSLRLQAGGLDVTPTPAPSVSTKIASAAPVIQSARIIRNSGGFNIEIVGYSTAREVTQASFTFSAGPGQTLQVSQIAIPVDTLFGNWFQDSTHNGTGSQFDYTQPFTIQGDATAVIPGSVTLTNRVGSATANVTQ